MPLNESHIPTLITLAISISMLVYVLWYIAKNTPAPHVVKDHKPETVVVSCERGFVCAVNNALDHYDGTTSREFRPPVVWPPVLQPAIGQYPLVHSESPFPLIREHYAKWGFDPTANPQPKLPN